MFLFAIYIWLSIRVLFHNEIFYRISSYNWMCFEYVLEYRWIIRIYKIEEISFLNNKQITIHFIFGRFMFIKIGALFSGYEARWQTSRKSWQFVKLKFLIFWLFVPIVHLTSICFLTLCWRDIASYFKAFMVQWRFRVCWRVILNNEMTNRDNT